MAAGMAVWPRSVIVFLIKSFRRARASIYGQIRVLGVLSGRQLLHQIGTGMICLSRVPNFPGLTMDCDTYHNPTDDPQLSMS